MSRPIRILVAIALALACAQAMAFQLVDAPTSLGWSAAEVQRAGQASLEQTLTRARREDRLGCARYCETLHRVFARLVAEARDQTARSAGLPWALTVVRLPEVDAFALPDGQVVISEVLIQDRGLSDEALAFVLAHEMAHSILEHERQMLSYGRLLLPRQVERSVPDMYVEIAHDFGLLRALEPVLHQTEFEADELGLLLAALAGYAPHRQIEFMQSEVAEDSGRQAVATSHPTATARLERLEARLPLARRLHELGAR